jgi:creatinine amidohydrolase
MIRLAERTYPEARRLARDARAVVIVPLGAVEQHGPHLPLLVDWLGAEELARRIAPHLERAGYRVILAPALPYGASPLARTWPGTVSLARATLRRVIVDVVRSLAGHGFRRFVLANYQADPEHLRAMAEAKREIRRGRGARGRGLRIEFAGFSPEASTRAAMLDPRVLRLSRSPRPAFEWHSGELETALVLARRPDLVRRGLARALPPGVGRLPGRPAPRRPALRGDRPGRARLLRLAGGGARVDRRAGDAAARPADRARDRARLRRRPAGRDREARARPAAPARQGDWLSEADWNSQ